MDVEPTLDIDSLRAQLADVQALALRANAARMAAEEERNQADQRRMAAEALAAKNSAEASAANDRLKLPKPPRPPTFSGEGYASESVNWIAHMEGYMKALGVSADAVALEHSKLYLEKSALVWWRNIEASVAGGSHPAVDTWQNFKELFEARWKPYNPHRYYRDRLDRLLQYTSVRKYTQDFQAITLELPSLTQDELLYRYTRGLKLECRKQVDIQQPKCLDSAISIAIAVDAALHPVGREVAPRNSYTKSYSTHSRSNAGDHGGAVAMDLGTVDVRTDRVCYNCGKPGHFQRDCRHPRKAGRQSQYRSSGKSRQSGNARA